ncbi:hypothetical protein [Streptomyces sp. NPDC057287]|uniref:hypothetical protein n=1 Tax=Streptomyces sp. NPDC057287 TaxID=3346086 RepID=UPI003633824C
MASALAAAVPLDIPTNQCGGLGSPLADQAIENTENCAAAAGASQCAANNPQTGGSFSSGTASGGGSFG